MGIGNITNSNLSSTASVLSYATDDKFIIRFTNNSTFTYFIDIKPVLNTVEQIVDKNKSDSANNVDKYFGTIRHNSSEEFYFYKKNLNYYFYKNINSTEKSITFKIYVYNDSSYPREIVGTLTTSESLKIDNRDFSHAATFPKYVLTTGGIAIGDDILFPTDGNDNLQIVLQNKQNITLNATSKNYFEHNIKFFDNKTVFKNLHLINNKSTGTQQNTTLVFKIIDKIKQKFADKTNFVGNFFKSSIFTNFIGSSHYGFAGLTKCMFQVFPGRLIYAWQNQYSFKNSLLTYNGDNFYAYWWQNDSSKTINLNVLASIDATKWPGTYASLPWPRIKYKVKVFAQQLPFDPLFNDNGYSRDDTFWQIICKELYNSSYETNTFKFLMSGFRNTFQSVVNDNITMDINGKSISGTGITSTVNASPDFSYTDNAKLYIYITTLDELGFYQVIHLTGALDNIGRFIHAK